MESAAKRARLSGRCKPCPAPQPEPATEDGDAEEEEEEEEEGEESEEEIEIAVDEDGRPPLPDCAVLPDYRFRAFPRFLPELCAGGAATWLEDLRADCQVAFTARAATKGEYSAGDTFWIGAADKPQTVLEELALCIFQLHAGKCTCDPATSGVEWWSQVIDCEDDIGWHWDRDYGLEADADFRLHPHLGTVTYLSDLGGPTVMLEAIEIGEEKFSKPLEVPVAYWSAPVVGRHVVFDGRWLHAAPADLAAEVQHEVGRAAVPSQGLTGKRITLLVNIWLNHRPRSIVAWGAAGRLRGAGSAAVVLPAGGVEEERVLRIKAGPDDAPPQEFSWTFGCASGSDSSAEDGEEEEEKDDQKAATTKPKAGGGREVRLALPLAAGRREAGGRLPLAFAMELPPGAGRVTPAAAAAAGDS